MRVMFAGDTHGNVTFARYLATTAAAVGADRVVQVDPFGYWEHEPEGVELLDDISGAAVRSGVRWVFVDGNHDNVDLLTSSYTDLDDDGFIAVRDHLSYAPRGHRWTWDGVRYAAFGGAYSVDKDWRLAAEAQMQAKFDKKARFRAGAGAPVRPRSAAGTLWFPSEEATDADLAAFLADGARVDVLITHDKPRSSSPDLNRKTFDACLANQDRIQAAAVALTPRLLVHGHLHYRYTDHVRVSGETWMQVEGLGADDRTAADVPGWCREDAWVLFDGFDADGQPVLTDA